MEQCRIKTNLPLATVRNQADKKKQVFTIAGDARPDERLRLMVTNQENMERVVVADALRVNLVEIRVCFL